MTHPSKQTISMMSGVERTSVESLFEVVRGKAAKQ